MEDSGFVLVADEKPTDDFVFVCDGPAVLPDQWSEECTEVAASEFDECPPNVKLGRVRSDRAQVNDDERSVSSSSTCEGFVNAPLFDKPPTRGADRDGWRCPWNFHCVSNCFHELVLVYAELVALGRKKRTFSAGRVIFAF
jgi:hypothetical protein